MTAIGNCPWCGGEGIVVAGTSDLWVACNAMDCGATGPSGRTNDLAITAWNRLATPGQGEVRGRVRWGTDSFGKPDRAIFIGNICAGHILDDYRRTKEGKPAWRAWVMRKDDDGEDLGWLDTEAAARAALETAVREAINADPL